MSEPIHVDISGDAQAYLKTFKDPSKVMQALARTMDRENQFTIARAQSVYMSLPSNGPTSPTALRVKSNRLRGSIRASKTVFTHQGLESGIGSNVVYAGILEDGGTTKPHVIKAKNAQALYFNGVWRRSVNHPGSRIGGRHYIRRAIQDRLAAYSESFSQTILSLK